MISRHIHILTLAILVGAPPVIHAQEKLPLHQHWEPGKIYHFEFNAEMEITPAAAGGRGTTASSFTMQFDVVVRREAGTQRKLADLKFGAMRAIRETGGEIMTFDSADPANTHPQMKAEFERSPLKDSTFVFDEKSELVEILAPAAPAGAAGRDGNRHLEMFAAELTFALPKAPVAVGETFSSERIMGRSPQGPSVARFQGKVEDIIRHEQRKAAKLVMEGAQYETDHEGNSSPSPGSKITAETLFDVERRCVLTTTVKTQTHPPGGNGFKASQTFIATLKGIDDVSATKQ